MPDPKEPHWHLNVEKLFKYTLVVAAACGIVFGKANVGEVDDVKATLSVKADRSELKTVDDRLRAEETSHAVANKNTEWILQDVKKANEKLDRLLETLIANRRRNGESGANDGNSPGLPGKDSGKPAPQPSFNGGNPVGPNPLNGD